MKTVGKVLVVIMGILMIIGGVYCMFTPTDTYLVTGWIVGFTMVFDAVGRFAFWIELKKQGGSDGWLLFGAIVSAVLGFFVLNSEILQLSIDAFLVYYIAIWLIVLGIVAIVRGHKIRKFHKEWDTKMIGKHWYTALILGILMIAFGVLCCFKPVVMTSTLGVIIGLGIVSTGCQMVTLATSPQM